MALADTRRRHRVKSGSRNRLDWRAYCAMHEEVEVDSTMDDRRYHRNLHICLTN